MNELTIISKKYLLIIALTFLITGCYARNSNSKYTLLKKGDFISASAYFDNNPATAFWSKNHSAVLFFKYIDVKDKSYIGEDQLWCKNIITGKKRFLIKLFHYERKPEWSFETSAWNPNGKNVIVNISKGGNNIDLNKLISINVANGKKTELFKNKFKIKDLLYYSRMVYSPNGEQIAISYNRQTGPGAGKKEVLIYSFKYKTYQIINLKGLSVIAGDWSVDNKKFALVVQYEDSQYAPVNIIIYDLLSGKYFYATKFQKAENGIDNLQWSSDNKYVAFNYYDNFKSKGSVSLYDVYNRTVSKLSLPRKLKNSQVVGWKNGSKYLLLVNKTGLWKLRLKE